MCTPYTDERVGFYVWPLELLLELINGHASTLYRDRLQVRVGN